MLECHIMLKKIKQNEDQKISFGLEDMEIFWELRKSCWVECNRVE